MLSKFKINLIFLLCMLSLVSIGFSSWSITLDAINVDANISVDNVIDLRTYVTKNLSKGDSKNGINTLQYNSYGFVLDDTISYTGQMKYYLLFKIEDFYNDFYQYDYVNLSFVLSYGTNCDSIILINYVSEVSVGYLFGTNENYTITPTLFNSSSIKNDKKITTNISLYEFDRKTYMDSYTGQILYLEITYEFTTSSNDYSNLYSDLIGKNINFTFNVFIEGCDSNEV